MTGSGVISGQVARGSTLKSKDSLRTVFRSVHHPFKAAGPRDYVAFRRTCPVAVAIRQFQLDQDSAPSVDPFAPQRTISNGLVGPWRPVRGQPRSERGVLLGGLSSAGSA